MSKVYTCNIDGVYGPEQVQVDTDKGDYSGYTLQCWLPSAGETSADARSVTFGAAGVDPEPPAAPDPAPAGPTAQDVADFLGESDNADVLALAKEHLAFVLAAIHAYTRGGGWNQVDNTPGPDIALVAIAAAARLVVNPANHRSETVGNYSVGYAGFIGWTLPERAILDRYRVRAL